ncbi:MAG: BMC domain-containing protein [Clostridia bacterium]|nr:BMC domain-containing protein [Clostridia bacterium]
MSKAIGMAEYQTVSAGIKAADLMIKTAEVEVIEAQVVCPGKYIVIITGELSAVRASVDAAQNTLGEKMIDKFVLGNPDETLLPAIYGVNEVKNKNALGTMETFNVAAMIVAADAAVKTAEVELIEMRLARGMCGKSYMLITGEVAAVTAALENAEKAAGDKGMFLDSSVIANPDEKLWETVM